MGRNPRQGIKCHTYWGSGPLHTWNCEPVTITLQALSLVEKVEPVQVRSTPRLRDQWSMWLQDGRKVYMDSYMSSNGSCFMVIRAIFRNHLLEVGLTQNWETMVLQMHTTIGLLALSVGQRIYINFSISRANFLTTLHSHFDVTCSCNFGSNLFNVDVNYSYIYLVNHYSFSLKCIEKIYLTKVILTVVNIYFNIFGL